jgi:hypothetical protein
MGLLHGLNYLHKSLVILVALLLLAVMLLCNIHISFFYAPSAGLRFAFMCLAFQAGELFHQRFYLDWKHECGLHWRVAVLQYAKWPFLLLALWDVLSARRMPYELTVKTKSGSQKPMLLVPNTLVILTLTLAGTVGVILHPAPNPPLHMTAIALVFGSILLMWSESVDFPAPFDPRLSEDRN